jgi:cobalamin transport system substrate-binding protein
MISMNRKVCLAASWPAIVLLTLTACEPDHPAEKAKNPRSPERIVALAPNAAEVLCDLGACDRLVGVSPYCTYPPQLAEIPKIGGLTDPDLETIVALRPDLVVLRGLTGPLRAYCRDRNITVYDDKVETLDDMYRTIAELGSLVNHISEADALVASVRTKLARVHDLTSASPPVKVLLVIMRSPGSLSNILSVGRETFLSELIEIAGGTNIFSEMTIRYPSVSLEEIVARAPDVIIELLPGDELDDERRSQLLEQWGVMTSIPAIRNSRVHFLSEGFISIPSPRVTLTAERFLSLIHPENETGE